MPNSSRASAISLPFTAHTARRTASGLAAMTVSWISLRRYSGRKRSRDLGWEVTIVRLADAGHGSPTCSAGNSSRSGFLDRHDLLFQTGGCISQRLIQSLSLKLRPILEDLLYRHPRTHVCQDRRDWHSHSADASLPEAFLRIERDPVELVMTDLHFVSLLHHADCVPLRRRHPDQVPPRSSQSISPRLLQSALKQIGNLQAIGPKLEVIAIQHVPLNSEHALKVVPLPVRNTATFGVPQQLVEDDVFRRGKPEGTSQARDFDLNSPRHILASERSVLKDEDVHLVHRLQMDQVEAPPPPNSMRDPLLVGVVLPFQ